MPMKNEKQKIVFVTGKGGVGKSVIALALAQKYSQSSTRVHSTSKKNPVPKVLLVELGLRSFYADFLGISVGYTPQKYKDNLDIALWSGPECLQEYAMHLLKLESLYKLFFNNRVSRTLIDIAPALSELSILGKITSGIRGVGPSLDYDIIVVDCYATGHMMALLKAPRGMNETIQFGPMAEQTKGMLETIRNPKLCDYMVVTLPEELPALEADELCREISQEVGIKPQLLCNKVWSEKEIKALKPHPKSSSAPLSEEELRFIQNLEDLVKRQQAWVHYLKHRYPDLQEIPMVFSSKSEEIISAIEGHLL